MKDAVMHSDTKSDRYEEEKKEGPNLNSSIYTQTSVGLFYTGLRIDLPVSSKHWCMLKSIRLTCSKYRCFCVVHNCGFTRQIRGVIIYQKTSALRGASAVHSHCKNLLLILFYKFAPTTTAVNSGKEWRSSALEYRKPRTGNVITPM